jgi:predicted AAA+ superfamily ATPase
MLCDTFIARQLPPFLSNTGKRQVKSPKVYLRDSGLLHSLLGITDRERMESHPILGASWEGFAMEQIIEALRVDSRHCYFWAVHTGAELDLLVERGGELIGFEFKRTLSPKITPSMRSAVEMLELSRLNVVYPGKDEFPMHDKIVAAPLAAFI